MLAKGKQDDLDGDIWDNIPPLHRFLALGSRYADLRFSTGMGHQIGDLAASIIGSDLSFCDILLEGLI